MLNLPSEYVLLDTEYTAWEGSQERKWTGPNEYREIVQIGAIKVDNAKLVETDHFVRYVRPRRNPILSEYFVQLTGVIQQTVDQHGIDFAVALVEFREWCGELPVYSFGRDGVVVLENCALCDIDCPFPPARFNNIRDFFNANGCSTQGYFPSTIVEAFGVAPVRTGHDALNDVRTILDGLVLLDKRLTA
jgi:inhibitor of KinA sporulation pathway (predicted exonuclease)